MHHETIKYIKLLFISYGRKEYKLDVVLLLHDNSCFANTPQYYGILTMLQYLPCSL